MRYMMHRSRSFLCLKVAITIVQTAFFYFKSCYYHCANSHYKAESGVSKWIWHRLKNIRWSFGPRKDFFGSIPAFRTSATDSFDMCEIGITRCLPGD